MCSSVSWALGYSVTCTTYSLRFSISDVLYLKVGWTIIGHRAVTCDATVSPDTGIWCMLRKNVRQPVLLSTGYAEELSPQAWLFTFHMTLRASVLGCYW